MIRRPDSRTWAQRLRERAATVERSISRDLPGKPANETSAVERPKIIDLAVARAAIARQQREQVAAERADLIGAYEADVQRGTRARVLRTWV